MSVDDIDDGPPGFVRATPEVLAELREEALADAERQVLIFLVSDCGLGAEAVEHYRAEAMGKIAEYYDRHAAPILAKLTAADRPRVH